ncbi:hypothetical protein D8S78_02795 [Natrialba swarupiae]|nr:hypothetical protein [Natrialba swarupiae]
MCGSGLSVDAFDAVTGEHEWTFPTEGSAWSSPTVVDGTVYFGCNGDEESDATLYAVDATTGDEIWRFTDPGDWVFSSRLSSTGRSTSVKAVELRPTTGIIRCLQSTQRQGRDLGVRGVDDQVQSSPYVSDGTVYVGSHDGSLYAIDDETGDEEWSFDPDREGSPPHQLSSMAPSTSVRSGQGCTR